MLHCYLHVLQNTHTRVLELGEAAASLAASLLVDAELCCSIFRGLLNGCQRSCCNFKKGGVALSSPAVRLDHDVGDKDKHPQKLEPS